MTDIDKLKEEEIAQLDGELNLEDLLILGDAKKSLSKSNSHSKTEQLWKQKH